MLTLQRIAPENAPVYKTVRLRALQSDPTAFGSTYAREARLSDEEWRQRALRCSSDGSTGYLAFDGVIPCGLVVCFGDEQNAQCAHVISMWVDPAYRRAGVDTALIDTVKSWLHRVACMNCG
jgi:GNAT superfamily N-acetyltransferase